jgi:hypothetical protein
MLGKMEIACGVKDGAKSAHQPLSAKLVIMLLACKVLLVQDAFKLTPGATLAQLATTA